MPDHFLALVKQEANLANNNEAQRSAAAVVSSLAATLDEDIFFRINSTLPIYLQIKPKRQFFLHRKKELKQFNEQIFLTRIVKTLDLTDNTEAENRITSVMHALAVVQPQLKQRLSSVLPSDLNRYW